MTLAKLRFCLCSTFYPPYGSDADAAYVQALAVGLARLGHEVTVLHNPDAYEVLRGEKVTEPYATHAGLTIRQVTASLKTGSLLAVQQTGRAWAQWRDLRECFRQPFDVVHYYNVSLLGGPELFSLGHSTLKLAGLSDHWLVCPMHILWKYTGEVCDTPQCVRCSLRNGKPPQFWRYTRLLETMSRHVDAFLGPSLFTMRKHWERGFCNPMIHLPSLSPIPVQSRSALTAPPVTRPYFLCTGRLEYYKGFQDVIPLFRDLSDCASLIICGQGAYERELRFLAEGIANVHFTGALSRDQLQVLYENAIATIVPTLAYQTFCHSTAESFSAGTPVIARKLGPAEEIITEHGGGILYTIPEELRTAIAKVIREDSTRLELGRQAITAHSLEFSEEVYLRRYLDIVGELFTRKAAGRSIRADEAGTTSLAGRTLLV